MLLDELEMKDLKYRLLETESQMTRILQAMETVQHKVQEEAETVEKVIKEEVEEVPDDDCEGSEKENEKVQIY